MSSNLSKNAVHCAVNESEHVKRLGYADKYRSLENQLNCVLCQMEPHNNNNSNSPTPIDFALYTFVLMIIECCCSLSLSRFVVNAWCD